MQRGRVGEIRENACNAGHDRGEADDGVQRGDHLRELRRGDAAPNNRTDGSTDGRNGGELREYLGREADRCERRENTGTNAEDPERVALTRGRL